MTGTTPTTAFNPVGVITKPGDHRLADTVQGLLSHLRSRHVEVLVDESATDLLGPESCTVHPRSRIAAECNLAIVVGGDGTLLHAARSLLDASVPMVGINRGRLGFLADISPEDMTQRIDDILAGRYNEDRRFMLEGRVFRGDECLIRSDAFNDVVVHAQCMVRMIEFDTMIDGRYLATQNADGLVVATPTGSTAYALSGGGPIVYPTLEAICLVPICPHTLTNRPIVVHSGSRIEIRICPHNTVPAMVSFDGQVNQELDPDDRIVIARRDKQLRLIQPPEFDYFQILRAKLKWSERP